LSDLAGAIFVKDGNIFAYSEVETEHCKQEFTREIRTLKRPHHEQVLVTGATGGQGLSSPAVMIL
jgi:hypothetical protein